MPSHRKCVQYLCLGLLFLACCVECLELGSDSWVCPEGIEPGVLSFPERGGSAVLQLELSSPRLATSDELKNTPEIPIICWFLIDRVTGTVRLDLPNPEAIVYILSSSALPADIPLLAASFYYQMGQEKILMAVPSMPYEDEEQQKQKTDPVCYDILVPSQIQQVINRDFFPEFQSRGEENVNSSPTFKWTHSIPLVGSFAYFTTCDSRQAPIQLSFQTATVLSRMIWDELGKIQQQIPANWTQPSTTDARVAMNLINWPSFQSSSGTPENIVSSQDKGFAKEVFEEEDVLDDDFFSTLDDDEYEESVSPFPSPSAVPSSTPTRTTTSTKTTTATSTATATAQPSLSTTQSPSELPTVQESPSVEASSPSSVPSPSTQRTRAWRSDSPSRSVESSTQTTPSPSPSTGGGSSLDKVPGEDLFVIRIVFLDWVSGVTDATLYVPPPYCRSGQARPLPSVTLPPTH